jgi:predicted nucleic acid-binding protein
MRSLIISDTACLILFDKIGELEILRELFKTIFITTKIAEEFKNKTPDWISIKDPTILSNVDTYSKIVDLGEASAIALSKETENSMLILDDLKARQLAEALELKYTGSIGILILAKRKGLIKDVNHLILKIQETNFRLTDPIIDKLREE